MVWRNFITSWKTHEVEMLAFGERKREAHLWESANWEPIRQVEDVSARLRLLHDGVR